MSFWCWPERAESCLLNQAENQQYCMTPVVRFQPCAENSASHTIGLLLIVGLSLEGTRNLCARARVRARAHSRR